MEYVQVEGLERIAGRTVPLDLKDIRLCSCRSSLLVTIVS